MQAFYSILVLTVSFHSLSPWGNLFQLFIWHFIIWSLLFQPIPECIQYRLFFFETELFSLLCSMIFCFWAPFTIKQLGTGLYSLHCRKAVIILFSLRYGICKAASHMCPTRASFNLLTASAYSILPSIAFLGGSFHSSFFPAIALNCHCSERLHHGRR